mgnify:CR=1 FL=1
MKRNLEYLHKHKVVYRRLPLDMTDAIHYPWGWHYEQGTHECYWLFASKAKITTFKSLKWHLLTLWYLNPQMDPDEFVSVAQVISNKEQGFTTFTIKSSILDKMIYEVSMMDLDYPPNNRARKVIFKPFGNLTINEKLSIVGKIIGRSKVVNQDDIYQCMLDLHDNGDKITIKKLASSLGVSARTIQRNIGEELKREKELLNREL